MPDLILSPVTSKTCTKCGETKPEENFRKTISSYGTLIVRNQCIQCTSARNKELRLRDSSVLMNSDRLKAIASFREENKKPCKCCGEVKPIELFRKKSGVGNFMADCKECTKVKDHEHYLKNKDKVLLQSKIYRAKNTEKLRKNKVAYVKENRQTITNRQARWAREKRKADPAFALKTRLRSMLCDAFRNGGYTKKARAVEILGCDWITLRRHMEMQFTKGMTWENRGAWEVDHIIPLALANTEADIISLNHFTNLRPLWAGDNNAKGAQITHLI